MPPSKGMETVGRLRRPQLIPEALVRQPKLANDSR